MGHSTTPRRGNRSVTTTAVAAALTCAAVAALVAGHVTSPAALTLDKVVQVVTVVPVLAVGLLLTLRRPANAVGWIVSTIGLIVAVQGLIAGAVARIDATGDVPPALAAVLWIDGKTFLLLWAGVIALFLYFPDGRLPSRRWWWAPVLTVAAVTVGIVGFALAPGPLREGLPVSAVNPGNPTAAPPEVWEWLAVIEPIGMVLLLSALVVSLASLVGRYRNADATTRVQIRWVTASAVVFGVLLLTNVAVRSHAEAWLPLADALVGVAFALVPVSLGVAILRYRLYEIDRLINRTVVYALLTAVLAGAYAVAVTAMRAVASPVTGDSAVAVAASTLVVAALFRPARSRIQRAVDHRFNRARYDAAKTVEAFSARLRDEVDLETLKVELVTVVCATMEPAGATLWLREAGR